MKHRFWARTAAFTLVEVMVAAAISSIVFAGLALGSVALQRTFAAVEGFGSAQSDQMRSLDYITRDVRRAQSVSVIASPPTLTLTVQTYIDPASGLPRNPTISGGAITYGGTTTIIYTTSGSNLVREESGNRLVVARSITAFAPSLDPADPLQKSVNITLTFASPMKWRSTPSTSEPMTLQAKAIARK